MRVVFSVPTCIKITTHHNDKLLFSYRIYANTLPIGNTFLKANRTIGPATIS